ncbi:MAG: hypothetical protein KF723_22075 [Rhizobiaceae bacterium]|nr:hypothetical protein [Rhizobiaceae bacterium]
MKSLSPHEESIKAAWLAGILSIRQIARDHEVSPTWVKKLAVKHDWGPRPERGVQSGVHPGATASAALIALRSSPSDGDGARRSASDESRPSETIQKAARTDPRTLAQDTIDILNRLKDELNASTAYLGEIEQMIREYTAGDKDRRHYNAMMKAVSMPTRILAAKNLALALKTLQEAQPGKKEQRRQAADTAGMDSLWGDDLDVEFARAN